MLISLSVRFSSLWSPCFLFSLLDNITPRSYLKSQAQVNPERRMLTPLLKERLWTWLEACSKKGGRIVSLPISLPVAFPPYPPLPSARSLPPPQLLSRGGYMEEEGTGKVFLKLALAFCSLGMFKCLKLLLSLWNALGHCAAPLIWGPGGIWRLTSLSSGPGLQPRPLWKGPKMTPCCSLWNAPQVYSMGTLPSPHPCRPFTGQSQCHPPWHHHQGRRSVLPVSSIWDALGPETDAVHNPLSHSQASVSYKQETHLEEANVIVNPLPSPALAQWPDLQLLLYKDISPDMYSPSPLTLYIWIFEAIKQDLPVSF